MCKRVSSNIVYYGSNAHGHVASHGTEVTPALNIDTVGSGSSSYMLKPNRATRLLYRSS